ncbi:PEP-CTERM sorting domain-containing protein [Massilia sp. DWR3-1-1]|uniref:PEP-CTERM sorting domain-containing protein n=1 Tax=Massilia sp. DWR3-1-1 TaxID=2804559 RepID=UPI003CF2BCA6
MITFLKHTCAVAALSLATVTCASATPVLTVQNGKLMGATNVLVNNVSYDVLFKDGSFNSLFPTGFAGTPWATSTFGVAASDALSLQVFTGAYDSTSALTNGCTSTSYCDIFTTFITTSSVVDGFDVSYFRNNSGTATDTVHALSNWTKSIDLSTYSATTYAVWSLHDTSNDLPEPATPVLFGLGLAALAIWRRRASSEGKRADMIAV